MNVMEIPWLSAIIFLPLVAALAIPLIPDKEGKTLRWYGLGVALLDFVFMIFALWQSYD
jgi:NAD(P)H-quinone oxidoreductase subunit 4